MKNAIFFLLMAASFTAKAQAKPQSLKDLLYGGKLKLDSTTVIRKNDDLASKIDTTTKKPVEPEKPKNTTATDNSVKKQDTKTVATVDVVDSSVTTTTAVKETTAPVKSNAKIWKSYTDSMAGALKTEVLSNKKIKKETYYLTVDYEIATDGAVNIINVVSDPENAFLQSEVKQRIEVTPPVLAPYIDSSNQPRKVKRKYNFSITKD